MARASTPFLLAVLTLCSASGCEEKPKPAPAPQSAAPSAAAGLVPGTPPGDFEDWLHVMRSGLDTVATELKTDRARAQKRVLDLYVTRQEYLEMYFGQGGRLAPTPELAESVKSAETRFHELMALTGAAPPASEDTIRRAIAAVQQQLDRVGELGRGFERRVRSRSTTEAAQ